jgi:hypothetical protein
MPSLTRVVRRMLETSWLLVGLVWANGSLAQAPESQETPLPSVTIIAPRPPTPQELAGRAVPDFIRMHARIVVVTGQLARWRTAICPITAGLSPAFNDWVSARILAVAASVGAPHQQGENCKGRHNAYVFFTADPARALDELEKQDPRLLGFHYLSETRDLKKVTRPIQGWYVTASRGARGGSTIDEAYPVFPWFSGSVGDRAPRPAGEPGSRLTSHVSSEIVNVVILVDVKNIVDQPIGPIADFVSVLALTQAFAPRAVRHVA